MRYIISFILVTILAGFTHKFYVSLTQVEYKPKSRTLEVATKLFTDDLEKVILVNSGDTLRLASKKEHPKADSLIFGYLKKHILAEVNGREVEFEMVGREIDNDVTWVYLEGEKLPKLKSLKIENTALMDQISEQKNMVTLVVEKDKKSFLFNSSKTFEVVEY
ncbi:MAG: hypothetical protein ACJATA_000461 [Sphingobacteriales bacterium]|jgi:hypothetical protein